MSPTSLLNTPEPANQDFVAMVRGEIDQARERALEVLGRSEPAQAKRPPFHDGERNGTEFKRRGRATGDLAFRPPTARERLDNKRRKRVLHDLMCGYVLAQIAEREGVTYNIAKHDADVLRYEYGARNIPHLCALGALDLGYAITFGRMFPDGGGGEEPMRAKPTGYVHERGWCSACGRDCAILKNGLIGAHSPIRDFARLSRPNGWCIGARKLPAGESNGTPLPVG